MVFFILLLSFFIKYGFFHFTSFVFYFDVANLTAFSSRIYVLINFDFTFCILKFALR